MWGLGNAVDEEKFLIWTCAEIFLWSLECKVPYYCADTKIFWTIFHNVYSELLYAVISVRPTKHFSYFAFCGYFASVSVKHTTKYETLIIHFSYFMQISCFINSQKNEPRNPLTFHTDANHGTKCKKWKKGCETQKKWRKIPHYTLFIFRISLISQ